MLGADRVGGLRMDNSNEVTQRVQAQPQLYKWASAGLEETLASQAVQGKRRDPASGPGEQGLDSSHSLSFSTVLASPISSSTWWTLCLIPPQPGQPISGWFPFPSPSLAQPDPLLFLHWITVLRFNMLPSDQSD